MPYELADESSIMVEITEETVAYILKSNRELADTERGERYHCLYSLDVLTYEDEPYAWRETTEDTLIREEDREEVTDWLTVLAYASIEGCS